MYKSNATVKDAVNYCFNFSLPAWWPFSFAFFFFLCFSGLAGDVSFKKRERKKKKMQAKSARMALNIEKRLDSFFYFNFSLVLFSHSCRRVSWRK